MNALRSQSLPNTDFKDPEQVLASLNAAFPSEENNDMFFTIWYGVYTEITCELTYASGGHPLYTTAEIFHISAQSCTIHHVKGWLDL
jgi:serine phosphatase RsbU (regulator of sigma subunit)